MFVECDVGGWFSESPLSAPPANIHVCVCKVQWLILRVTLSAPPADIHVCACRVWWLILRDTPMFHTYLQPVLFCRVRAPDSADVSGWSSESPVSSTPIYDLSCFVECEHLIRRMLVVEPKRRYSLSQIKAHKWMQRDGGPPTQRPPSPEVSTAHATPAQPRGEYHPPSACPARRWVPPSQRLPSPEVNTAQTPTYPPAQQCLPSLEASATQTSIHPPTHTGHAQPGSKYHPHPHPYSTRPART